MKNSTIVGLAMGALVGAVVVNSFQPANDMIDRAKGKVRDMINKNELPLVGELD